MVSRQIVSDRDRAFMARAVELGRRGWGRTRPNPLVGCVLVRDGEVVSQGWHADFGGPHAEAVALREAGERARGATAYISLEPCAHEGKTPPCTRALREAGVRRVVFGARDPGGESGGGAAQLEEAGVEVAGPLLTDLEAKRGNPAFFHDDPERPWVALKLAVSLDGRISVRKGVRTDITGREAIEEVHWLRAGFDALMVGTNTVLVDDPVLTVRGRVVPRLPPRRVILDARGKLSPDARVLREGEAPVCVVTTSGSDGTWRASIGARGATLVEVPAEPGGRVELSGALRALRRDGMRSVLCEGGGRLASELLARGLVDRLHLVLAPRFLGSEGVPAFPALRDRRSWTLIEPPRQLGEDVWMVLEPETA